jgi:hypothetical protein
MKVVDSKRLFDGNRQVLAFDDSQIFFLTLCEIGRQYLYSEVAHRR